MAAGIGAALLALFSETRKLAFFPTEAVEVIILTGVLIYNVVVLALKMLSLDQVDIRPGKLRWSNEAYLGFAPSALFSLIVLIVPCYHNLAADSLNSQDSDICCDRALDRLDCIEHKRAWFLYAIAYPELKRWTIVKRPIRGRNRLSCAPVASSLLAWPHPKNSFVKQ